MDEEGTSTPLLRESKRKSIYGNLRRRTVKKHSTFLNRLVIAVPPLVAEACSYLQQHGTPNKYFKSMWSLKISQGPKKKDYLELQEQ